MFLSLCGIGFNLKKMAMNDDSSDEFDLFRKNSGEENKITPVPPEDMTEIYPESPVKENQNPAILIVDDDLNVRTALEMVLRNKYDLILCSNGNEGIAKIDLSISVVILDIKMEGKNGFETFTEIKKLNPFIPIIFHSAYQDLKSPYEIMNDYRPFGYVIKEGDGRKLLHTIESAVGYYQQINKNLLLVNQLRKKNKILEDLQDGLEVLVEMRTKELHDALNKLSSVNTTLHKLSITDGLTGLVNRRHFDLLFHQECTSAIQNNTPLSLIMIDIDFFKKYNDTYGHPAGDAILKAVSAGLRDTLEEPSDVIARYGGEEFVVILPVTGQERALSLAETMRKNIEKSQYRVDGLEHCVTISLGVSAWIPDNRTEPFKILELADAALYKAKNNGRNRVGF